MQFKMATETGLRGRKLNITMSVLAALVFMMQGYDQALVNGLLTLDTWVKTFPGIDTVNTTGETKAHQSKIQGKLMCSYSWDSKGMVFLSI